MPDGMTSDDLLRMARVNFEAEPGELEEGRTLYVTDGWPVAVYEFDIGYTVIRGALLAAQ